jgi:hypothetical protein
MDVPLPSKLHAQKLYEGGKIANRNKHQPERKIWGFYGGDSEEWCLWDVTPCGSCKNRRFGGT